MGEDGDDTKVWHGVFWVDVKAWGKANWLQLILEQRHFGQGLRRMAEEDWLLTLAQKALPGHPLLEGDLGERYGVLPPDKEDDGVPF